MNPVNPIEFLNAFKADQWTANVAGYARTVMAELEKQSARWTEYTVSQAAEANRLLSSVQSQAFGVGKTIIDTAEKAFGKAGA